MDPTNLMSILYDQVIRKIEETPAYALDIPRWQLAHNPEWIGLALLGDSSLDFYSIIDTYNPTQGYVAERVIKYLLWKEAKTTDFTQIRRLLSLVKDPILMREYLLKYPLAVYNLETLVLAGDLSEQTAEKIYDANPGFQDDVQFVRHLLGYAPDIYCKLSESPSIHEDIWKKVIHSKREFNENTAIALIKGPARRHFENMPEKHRNNIKVIEEVTRMYDPSFDKFTLRAIVEGYQHALLKK